MIENMRSFEIEELIKLPKQIRNYIEEFEIPDCDFKSYYANIEKLVITGDLDEYICDSDNNVGDLEDEIGMIDDGLISNDYIIGDITIDNIKYTIVHGFPRCPNGWIFNENEIHNIGELYTDEPYSVQQQWYMDLTDNVMNYDHITL